MLLIRKIVTINVKFDRGIEGTTLNEAHHGVRVMYLWTFFCKKKNFLGMLDLVGPGPDLVRTLQVQVQTNYGLDLRSRSRSAKICLDRDRTGPWTVYIIIIIIHVVEKEPA